jgi:mRNA-degrading endonuclease RelE of RelBE toxin-antitoxin system
VDERALADLRAIHRKDARLILQAAHERLSIDPLAETRNMKTLRPNPIAERELRLFGKYRVLFTVNQGERRVLIFVVGEKRGQSLFVRGQRFTHYENHPNA